MEKEIEIEMEKQTDTKLKNNSLNLIVILLIIFISFGVLFIILNCFLFSKNNQSSLNENTLNKNAVSQSNSPIISAIPDEKNEINDTQNSELENSTQESDINQESNTDATNLNTSNNTINTSRENSNQNTNYNSNSNSSSKEHTNGNTTTNSNSTTDIPEHNSTGSNSNTESPNHNSTGSNSNAETKPSPETPSIPELKPYKVKTETSTELSKAETKYGVIIRTYTTSTYDIYSDGSKKVINSSDRLEYDKTNYNATTSALIPEAKKVRNKYSSLINQVFKNTNSYRQEANNTCVNGITNRTNLTLNENLCIAACARAVEMAYSSKFSHTRPNGSKCFTILKEMNISFRTAAENISYGYSSAYAASEGWKNSQGHYDNMISPDFSQIGIGVIELEGSFYWVQIFN